MNRPILELLVRSCVSVAASVILISSAEVTPANAAESFTPTMKDMLSIQGAIERYERGMDTGDRKLQASAFWDDAVIVSPMGRVPFNQAIPGGAPPAGGGGGPGAVPPGAGGPPGGPGAGPAGAGRPPSISGIPVGPNGLPERPPSCDPTYQKPETGWHLWHIVANSSFEFLSPTRVKHHAYWFAVCPSAGAANGAGIGSVGPPGSYNDILEKRNGEWRFVERNIALNEMYSGQPSRGY
jgi:hypothetical protein